MAARRRRNPWIWEEWNESARTDVDAGRRPLCVAGRRRGLGGGQQGRHRRHRRHVGTLRRRHRPARRRGDQNGDRRFRWIGARPADRDSDLRSSEQAGARGREAARMGRHRRHDDAARRVQLRGQPRDVRRGQGEEGSLHRHRRGRGVADRQGLQRPTRSTTATTRPRSPTARRRRFSSRAARAGSSSPRTTPSGSNSRPGRRRSSRRAGEA